VEYPWVHREVFVEDVEEEVVSRRRKRETYGLSLAHVSFSLSSDDTQDEPFFVLAPWMASAHLLWTFHACMRVTLFLLST
jgi:hypothetical protein